MTPDEEFLSFAVVIHHTCVIDNRLAAITTKNVIELAANEARWLP